MRDFFRGGRGLPQGQGYVCSIIQNNRYRLLLPLGRYSRSKFETQRSDAVGVLIAYSHWPKAFLIIFCVLFSGFLVPPVYGQEAKGLNEVQPLHITQRVPDEFWTQEHLFYVNGDTVRKNLEEYKGKMLVLGFWATWCSTCLKQQKDIESFLKEYADKVNVIKVNSIQTKDTFARIKKALTGIVGKRNDVDYANFLSIIDDSYLFKIFPHYAYPHYVWIDKNGVVQIFTYRNLLDRRYPAPFID